MFSEIDKIIQHCNLDKSLLRDVRITKIAKSKMEIDKLLYDLGGEDKIQRKRKVEEDDVNKRGKKTCSTKHKKRKLEKDGIYKSGNETFNTKTKTEEKKIREIQGTKQRFHIENEEIKVEKDEENNSDNNSNNSKNRERIVKKKLIKRVKKRCHNFGSWVTKKTEKISIKKRSKKKTNDTYSAFTNVAFQGNHVAEKIDDIRQIRKPFISMENLNRPRNRFQKTTAYLKNHTFL